MIWCCSLDERNSDVKWKFECEDGMRVKMEVGVAVKKADKNYKGWVEGGSSRPDHDLVGLIYPDGVRNLSPIDPTEQICDINRLDLGK